MIYNAVEDISVLTTIPLKTLYKLTDKCNECICNDVLESKTSNDITSIIDIGIGKLNINVTPKDITYTFVPSKELEIKLLNTIKNNESPLIKDIENSLTTKILNTYKDLI